MAEPVLMRNDTASYDEDFALWVQDQARLLRERRFAELDLDHLVDEVESVGKSERREIDNRLTVLIAHLLKWRSQPGGRSSGWRATIIEQRRRLAKALQQSPSLKSYPADVFDDCYLSGRLQAAAETGIDFTLFPEAPPFTIDQALRDDYLPKEPDRLDFS